MGFHLVEKVYSNVTGTSPTAQAVLAYLAHKADDKGVRKCFPAVAMIEAATHFGHTAITSALNDLREAELLVWKRGGRLKGEGGRALANEYAFNLPAKPSASIHREAANAYTARRSMHTPPGGQCIHREAVTINKGQPSSQPAVNGASEAATADLKAEFSEIVANWSAKRKEVEARAEEAFDIRERMRHSVVDEAMKASGVDDIENRRIFSSTLCRRDPDQALEVIWRFASEFRQGEYKGVRNLAAQLNKILALLPIIN